MFRLGKKFLLRDPPSKRKIFWHKIWLDTCSDWEKNFLSRDPPSKGNNFWHQIWLDTCSDQEKNFCQGTPPPSKRKIFWHQIWLDTCSDWEKNFLSRNPPPTSKGKNFWHQIWLDTCSDWEKRIFVKGPPPLELQGLAMATRRAVCLLRSRRRTFLFHLILWRAPFTQHYPWPGGAGGLCNSNCLHYLYSGKRRF